jgi:hypothetical protein
VRVFKKRQMTNEIGLSNTIKSRSVVRESTWIQDAAELGAQGCCYNGIMEVLQQLVGSSAI